jgi:hypothetical protein
MVDKEDNITNREALRLQQERIDALKGELGIKQNINTEEKLQLSLSRQVAAQALDFIGKQADGLRKTKDIQKDLTNAERLRVKLAGQIGKENTPINKILSDSLDIQKGIIKGKEEELKKSQGIDKSLGLAGKSLSIFNKLLGGTLGDTGQILQDSREQLNSQDAINNKMKGFGAVIGNVGKGIANSLNDPMTYLLLLLENSTSVNQFQKELGLSYGSAIGLRNEMSQIAVSTGDVFITSAKLQKSFFGMSESLGFIADFSGQTLETMTNLEQRLGLATGEAAEMTMLFKLQGNNTEEIASNTFDTLTNSIKLGNVAVTPKQVFAEIAKTTKSIQVSLGANPEAIGKAIIAAKQLGATLADIDSIAASTLDFESSISNELEAELLTGKQLNLERARLLALNNDFAGVAEEIAKQGINFASFSKMNRLQQEATAKALGLSRDRLSEITLQQQMQTMSSEEIKNNFGEGAYEQAKSLAAQEKFTLAVEKVKGLFSDILVILTPLIDGVALVADFASSIGGAFTAVGGAIGYIVSIWPKLIAGMKTLKGLSIGEAIAKIFSGNAKLGPVGIGLAVGATAGMLALIAKNTMDDGIISPDGGMVVSGPKGSIQLNKQDSIIAGTNLGGGGGGTEIDYDKMASAMSKAQVNVSTKYDSFSSNSTTANGGRYQSTARYESKFV